VLQHLPPEQVEVEICRADELAQRRGLSSELDEMWSFVGKKAEPRWLWHAIDHASGRLCTCALRLMRLGLSGAACMLSTGQS
jgi:insertion element IS1 protein InsB